MTRLDQRPDLSRLKPVRIEPVHRCGKRAYDSVGRSVYRTPLDISSKVRLLLKVVSTNVPMFEGESHFVSGSSIGSMGPRILTIVQELSCTCASVLQC